MSKERNLRMRQRRFHLADPSAWSAFATGGAEEYTPEGYAAEGFLHLSFPDQLEGTLERHFQGVPELELVEVCRKTTLDGTVLEPATEGALFPHLYRPIQRGDVLRTWRVARRDGAWALPSLGEAPEDDAPAGSEGP